MVRGIREVNPDARQLVVLLLQIFQPEPIARQEEPAVSVDVESLLGIPSGWPSRRTIFLRGEMGVMGQYIGSDRYFGIGRSQSFGWKSLRCRFVRKKRVPGFDHLVIEPN